MAAVTPEEMAARLVELETRFGGRVIGTKRHASIYDDREDRLIGRIQGGDRMAAKHQYASIYARHLAPRLDAVKTLVEVGVFRGTGLAIWCELFPGARVIGLDIDLSHYAEAAPKIIKAGAFSANEPSLRTYDQLAPCSLDDALDGRQIDVYIDDGLHTDEAILTSLNHVIPHLSPGAACFLEDTATVGPKVKKALPEWEVIEYANLVFVSPP